jgi:hypothetical protein
MSIRGWSTWLMRMRLAMVSRRRSSVGEGVGGMGGSWLGETVVALVGGDAFAVMPLSQPPDQADPPPHDEGARTAG